MERFVHIVQVDGAIFARIKNKHTEVCLVWVLKEFFGVISVDR